MSVVNFDGNMSHEQKSKSKYRGYCIEISGLLFSLTFCLFFRYSLTVNLSYVFQIGFPGYMPPECGRDLFVQLS